MTVNRQAAKERGLRKDIDRERKRANDYAVVLGAVAAFVADDAVAITYQTLGQYRSDLLKLLRSAS